MRILHVITGLNVGGAETMLARLTGWQVPGIEHEIVSLMKPGMVGARIAAAGVPVHHLGMRAGIPSLRAACRLAVLARRIRPDLVMGWMHHGQLAASFAAMMTPGDLPVIWNVRHSLDGYRHEKRLSRLLLRIGAWLSAAPAAVIYNSRTAARQYRSLGYRPRREAVIPNGFDAAQFRPAAEARSTIKARFRIPGDPILIGMVARNHPMKDVANLVAAFCRLRQHRSDVHLLVAGDDMDKPSDEVRRGIAALPSSCWTLSGHRTDVPQWLAGLDILALSSAWGEGFPNILGEAMACGVPCVATDIGDARWIIGGTGRVVAPRDPDALAAALQELCALGREDRLALGRSARARVEEKFILPTIVDAYAELCWCLTEPSNERARIGPPAAAGELP